LTGLLGAGFGGNLQLTLGTHVLHRDVSSPSWGRPSPSCQQDQAIDGRHQLSSRWRWSSIRWPSVGT
jgi:hypothetical protein